MISVRPRPGGARRADGAACDAAVGGLRAARRGRPARRHTAQPRALLPQVLRVLCSRPGSRYARSPNRPGRSRVRRRRSSSRSSARPRHSGSTPPRSCSPRSCCVPAWPIPAPRRGTTTPIAVVLGREVRGGLRAVFGDRERLSCSAVAVLARGLPCCRRRSPRRTPRKAGRRPRRRRRTMAADPAGCVMGAWLFTRFAPSGCGPRLIWPLALLAGLPLAACRVRTRRRRHRCSCGPSRARGSTVCLVQAWGGSFVRGTPDGLRGARDRDRRIGADHRQGARYCSVASPPRCGCAIGCRRMRRARWVVVLGLAPA